MNNKPLVGVWVDHRRALLFWSDEQADMDVQEIGSNYQEEGEPTDQVKIAGNNVHGGGVAHAHLEDRRREQLKHFYKELDKNLRPAEEIYIFGPGQAKKELANYLKGDKSLKAALKGIEGADKKLTRAQKAEQVREFFALPRQPI